MCARNLNWRGKAAACLGLGVALCTALAAQTAPPSRPPDDLADISLEQLAQVPVEFVTGASKYEQSIRRAPASVTVLSSEELANHSWRTLSAALQTTPGFHLRSDRFYDYIGNRGFTRAADYNSRTLILVDGHRINDPIYQQGSVGTDFLLDPEMIKRIEIIRGPGSSVYGSSAFYGAVNVIPKGPSDFLGGQLSLTVDNEAGIKGRATVGDRTVAGLEYLVSASQLETPGEKDFPLPDAWRDSTGFANRTARNFDGTSSRSLFSSLRYHEWEWQTAYGKRIQRVLPPVYNTDLQAKAWGMDERAYSFLRYTSAPDPDRSIVVKFAYDHYRYLGFFRPLLADFTPLAPYARGNSFQGEARLRQTFAGRHIFLAGVEYQDNFTQRIGRQNLATGNIDVSVDTDSHFVSPFVQVDWTLLPNLFASTGARWDDYSTGEERATPRLGLMWDLSPSTHAKAIFGESFRVPNVDERNSQELGFLRNPGLKSETNQSVELVLSHRLNEVWTLEANGFRTRSHDLILLVPMPDPNDPTETVYMYDNKQVITTEGVELAATGFLKSNIQIRSSVTLQQAIDRAMPGRAIYDAPRRLYKASISAPLFTSRFRGTLEAQYTSERLDSESRVAGDYLTVNASLRLSKLYRRWDLSLTAYNLTNERWSDPKNEGQILGRPRVIALRATVDF